MQVAQVLVGYVLGGLVQVPLVLVAHGLGSWRDSAKGCSTKLDILG